MEYAQDFVREFLPNIIEVLLWFFLAGMFVTGVIMRIK